MTMHTVSSRVIRVERKTDAAVLHVWSFAVGFLLALIGVMLNETASSLVGLAMIIAGLVGMLPTFTALDRTKDGRTVGRFPRGL